MSGGHFDYAQYRLTQIADDIRVAIDNNDNTEVDEYGSRIGRGFRPETIVIFERSAAHLVELQATVTHIDHLLSGDTSEKTFLTRVGSTKDDK